MSECSVVFLIFMLMLMMQSQRNAFSLGTVLMSLDTSFGTMKTEKSLKAETWYSMKNPCTKIRQRNVKVKRSLWSFRMLCEGEVPREEDNEMLEENRQMEP